MNTTDMRLAHRRALLPLLGLEPELDLRMTDQIHLSQVREQMEQLASLGLGKNTQDES